MRKKCRSAREDLERAEVGRTSGAATEGLSVQTRGTQKQIEALTAGLQKVTAQLAAASPSGGGLEASKFAMGRIRGGKPAPQVANNP